jgi:hypothetical protein
MMPLQTVQAAEPVPVPHEQPASPLDQNPTSAESPERPDEVDDSTESHLILGYN